MTAAGTKQAPAILRPSLAPRFTGRPIRNKSSSKFLCCTRQCTEPSGDCAGCEAVLSRAFRNSHGVKRLSSNQMLLELCLAVSSYFVRLYHALLLRTCINDLILHDYHIRMVVSFSTLHSCLRNWQFAKFGRGFPGSVAGSRHISRIPAKAPLVVIGPALQL